MTGCNHNNEEKPKQHDLKPVLGTPRSPKELESALLKAPSPEFFGLSLREENIKGIETRDTHDKNRKSPADTW